MLCSKLHCQRYLNLILFSCKITVVSTGDIAALSRTGFGVQGYLAYKNSPPPLDHRRALGTGLLQGPRRGWSLMSVVPLYRVYVCGFRVQGPEPRVQGSGGKGQGLIDF